MTLFEHSINLQNEILKALGEYDDSDKDTTDLENTLHKDISLEQEIDKEDLFIDNEHEDIITPTLPFSIINESSRAESPEDADIIKQALSGSIFSGGKNVIDMIGDNLKGGSNITSENETPKQDLSPQNSILNDNTLKGGSAKTDDSSSDDDLISQPNNNAISTSPFEQIYESEKEDNNTDNPFEQIFDASDNSDLSNNTSEDSDSENLAENDTFEDKYVNIINELKDYETQEQNTSGYTLSGGTIPVTRVRIINAFPYIIKSNTTK